MADEVKKEALGKAQTDNNTPAEKTRRETVSPQADKKTNETEVDNTPVETSRGQKFFRSVAHSQLSVQVGDEIVARFKPYSETWQGDQRRVGYLATDDKEVIERLSTDGNVEEIEKSEFEKATGPKSFALPVQAS